MSRLVVRSVRPVGEQRVGWAIYDTATGDEVGPKVFTTHGEAITEMRRLTRVTSRLRLVPRPSGRCERCGLRTDWREALNRFEESCRCDVAGVSVGEILGRGR